MRKSKQKKYETRPRFGKEVRDTAKAKKTQKNYETRPRFGKEVRDTADRFSLKAARGGHVGRMLASKTTPNRTFSLPEYYRFGVRPPRPRRGVTASRSNPDNRARFSDDARGTRQTPSNERH